MPANQNSRRWYYRYVETDKLEPVSAKFRKNAMQEWQYERLVIPYCHHLNCPVSWKFLEKTTKFLSTKKTKKKVEERKPPPNILMRLHNRHYPFQVYIFPGVGLQETFHLILSHWIGGIQKQEVGPANHIRRLSKGEWHEAEVTKISILFN